MLHSRSPRRPLSLRGCGIVYRYRYWCRCCRHLYNLDSDKSHLTTPVATDAPRLFSNHHPRLQPDPLRQLSELRNDDRLLGGRQWDDEGEDRLRPSLSPSVLRHNPIHLPSVVTIRDRAWRTSEARSTSERVGACARTSARSIPTVGKVLRVVRLLGHHHGHGLNDVFQAPTYRHDLRRTSERAARVRESGRGRTSVEINTHPSGLL